MHEARQYVVLHHPQEGDQKLGLDNVPSHKLLGDATLESTGKKLKISGFQCHQVLAKDKSGVLTELWIAENAMDMNIYLSEFQHFGEFNMSQMLGELEKHPELQGVLIRVIQYEDGKMKMRSTVKELDTAKIPSSVFEVPAGYAELKVTNNR